MSEYTLQVRSVSKIYPARWRRPEVIAVENVSFDLVQGEILGLLGPNGAGKTTTIKMITGLIQPTTGQIVIGQYDVAHHRRLAVSHLGAVLEGNRNLHWKLTIAENLHYFGALKGTPHLKQRSRELIDSLGLAEHEQKLVGHLSRGLQQRLAIAIALLNHPRVLLLDEPTLGLDVVAASQFKETVRAIAQNGCGVILTTHQMEVAQALSDRIAIIAHGKLAVIDSLSQLQAAHRTPGYEIAIRGGLSETVKKSLESLGATAFDIQDPFCRFTLPEEASNRLYPILDALRDADIELVSLQQQEVNLEEIYRRIIGAQDP